MNLVRDLFLIFFAMILIPVMPAYAEILNMSNWDELRTLFASNPLIIVSFAIPLILLIILMLFIHKIDTLVDGKSEKRHEELLKAVKDKSRIIRRFSYGKGKHKQ